MFKVLISDNVAQECVDILAAAEGIEVDFNTKLSPEEFVKVIPEYDALVVRSATKVRGDAIAAAKKLKVIGRAGAGVDNIDVSKATDAGIIVMNTPGGNTVSTAEHTFSMIMALSRNIPQADRSIKEGRWDRKKYMGVELRGKTLGIIGLGNIGRVLAKRANAFEMTVIGFDPFITKEMAHSAGIELVTLEDIWTRADYITIHTPLNDSTRHIINAETLEKCKAGVRIINCARGGVVDEKALLAAIESGKVAGAAIDVYESEPPDQNPLVMNEKVVSTPHLGASTSEAQDIVAVMVAEQIRNYLLNGEVKNAVNVPSISPEVYEQVKPFIDMGQKLGSLLGQLGKGQLKSIEIIYYGDVHKYDTWPVTSSILQGLFTRSYSEDVNIINATSTAEKLGIKVDEIKSSDNKDYKNCIAVSITTNEGNLRVLGTIFGKYNPRVVNFQGYDLDFVPEGHLLICGNHDRPGIIGDIGTILGKKGINIAHMNWARKSPAGEAIVILKTDETIKNDLLAEIGKINGITWAECVEL
ncbi:MAG: phosphoglycerate dehydrogenase [Candidatus Latescibacteria bacterium]|nr:phosphoglycerate dehydrogenase [Candidatus Latescibacterota bacterium]